MKRAWWICLILLSMIGFQPLAPAYAEPEPTWDRALSFGGSGSDQANAVKVDQLGNQYVTGYFSGNASFGSRVLSSAGGRDIFLAKFAPGGQLIWLVQAGGTSDDAGNDLALDRAGNIYVTGSFANSASFRSTNGGVRTAKGTPYNSSVSLYNIGTIFLAKYKSDGELLWINIGTIPQGDWDVNEGLGVAAVPETGTVYLTGTSSSETTFSSSDGLNHSVLVHRPECSLY